MFKPSDYVSQNANTIANSYVSKTAEYCDMAKETGNTNCYIYKDNKLIQTMKCKYDHTEGGAVLDYFTYLRQNLI